MNGSEKTSKFRKYVPKYGVKNSDDRSAFGKYVPAFVFIVFIFGMAIWFILSPKTDYSSSEKRYLQKFPEASFENIENGNFGNEFETILPTISPSEICGWVLMPTMLSV